MAKQRALPRRHPVAAAARRAALAKTRIIRFANRAPSSLTILEELSVTALTRADYQTRMSSFIVFCQANQLNWVDVTNLGVCVCEFFDQMFLNGYGGEERSKYLAALAPFFPEVSRMGPFSLPRATRAIRGWTEPAPRRQRLPLPRVLLYAVIGAPLAAQRVLWPLHCG